MSKRLSVIIPVKNEEDFLENCIKSVSFADEVVVLDSGSTDDSIKIARKLGARVVKYEWQGYRYAHNFGAEQAKGEWLLYIDADERVSKNLAKAIKKTLKKPKHIAYQVNRCNYILGKAMYHGGWYPDRVTRLMKKNGLVDWIGELHEYPHIDGDVGTIEADLYHLTHRGIDWSLEKSRTYTKMTAEILLESAHPKVGVKNFFGAMIREFWYRAIQTGGWKDGIRGWIEILYQTFNAFLVQAQLWELQQKESMEERYLEIDRKIAEEISDS